MHQYLRSIGFVNRPTRKEMNQILNEGIQSSAVRSYTTNDAEENSLLASFDVEMGKGFGVCVCGQFDADDRFYPETYFPYLESDEVSTSEEIDVNQRVDVEAYSGVCDDLRMGVTLIFRVHNYVEYLKSTRNHDIHDLHPTTSITALSTKGSILMPLYRTPEDKQNELKYNRERFKYLTQARDGDVDAMEKATGVDMETTMSVSDKIRHSDVFSLVDTCCMPAGAECEMFTIVGEIRDVDLLENCYTKSQVYVMKLTCNDMNMAVAISREDLYGEPAVGRRFRGDVWLQGHLYFPNLSDLDSTGKDSGEQRAENGND